MTGKIISRIAPTPSGYLHAGNAYNFILTYLFTRAQNGVLHLRIDDYDEARYRDEYAQNIFDVLEFLELNYDCGAKNLSEFKSKFSSKFRRLRYRKALEILGAKFTADGLGAEISPRNLGGKIYACECSRGTPNAYARGVYQGLCADKNLSYEAGKTAIRFRVSRAVKNLGDENFSECDLPEIFTNEDLKIRRAELISERNLRNLVARNSGDFMIYKKDGASAYNFASVIDDEDLGVNFLVRGGDLADCSAAQILLARELNLNFKNASFVHHGLLLKDGKKLSKSAKAPAINPNLGAKFYYEEAARNLGLNLKSADNLKNLLNEFYQKFSADFVS